MAILPDVMERCNNRVNRGFMVDIFISYAREDLDRVKPIVEELKKRDWSVFLMWKAFMVVLTGQV